MDESDGSATMIGFSSVLSTSVFCRLNVETGARFNEVAHHQTNGQRKGGHQDKIGQRNAAGFTYGCCRADRADAQNDGAEDHRGDHHLDQVDEHRSDNLEFGGCAGCHQPEDNASDNRNDHSDVKPVGPVFSWLF